MEKRDTYSVKQLATLSGVTVRTLHHYDAIRLLSPHRLLNGYRLYTYKDALRLQQILVNREMGMSLDAIKQRLDDPDFDYSKTLVKQRTILSEKIGSYTQMITSIDAALSQLDKQKGDTMSLYAGFNPEQYEAEVKEKWGEGEAYAQSQSRTKNYTNEDWQLIKQKEEAWLEQLKKCFLENELPQSLRACALAEEHRLHIDKWFYPCSGDMHQQLGDMYVSDDRFKEYYDKKAKGLAAFLQKAIYANSKKSM